MRQGTKPFRTGFRFSRNALTFTSIILTVKTKTLLTLLLCGVIHVSPWAQPPIRQMLILGDSHLNGQFGEFLQKKLHESKAFDIYSIAIGGAGSRHFTMTMRNHCCGFRIRESCYGETYTSKDLIRTLEKASTGTNEIVGKAFKGQLKNVLAYLRPDVVVIALGNNYVNDHQTLVNMIKAQSPDTRIIWVGPMLRMNLGERMTAINQVVKKNSLFLVRSDDILGSDTLTSGHFYGTTAKNWAYKVAERMKPALHSPQ